MFANLPRIKGSAVKRAIPATLQRIYSRYPNARPGGAAPAMQADVVFAGEGASCALDVKATQTKGTKKNPARTVASVTGTIILPTLADDTLLPRLHAEHWLAYSLHELAHAMYSMPRAPRMYILGSQAVQYAGAHGAPGESDQWARNHGLLHHAWNCLEDPRIEYRLIADDVAANYADVATPLMQSLIAKWPAQIAGKKNLGLAVCYLARTWLPADLRATIRDRIAPALLELADRYVRALWALPVDTLAHSNITEENDPAFPPFAVLVAQLAHEMQIAPAPVQGPAPQPGGAGPDPDGEPGNPDPDGDGDTGDGEPAPGDTGDGEPAPGDPGDGEPAPGDPGDGEPAPGDPDPDGEPGDTGDGEPAPGDPDPDGEPAPGDTDGDGAATGHGTDAGRDTDTSTGALDPYVPNVDVLPEPFTLPPETCKAPAGLPDPLSAFNPIVSRVLPVVADYETQAGAQACDAARRALVQNNAGAVSQHVRRLLSKTDQSEMRRGLRSGRLHVRSLPRVLAQNGENAFQRRLESGLENAAVVMALDASISMEGAKAQLMGSAVFALSDAIRRCHGAKFGAFTYRGSRHTWNPSNVRGVYNPNPAPDVEFDGGDGQTGNVYTIKAIGLPLHWPDYCARLNRAVCDVSGGTPELVGLAHAIKELIPVRAGRKFVLFFTDGDGFRAERFHALIEQAARYGITVVGFGMQSFVSQYFRPGHSVDVKDLRGLAGVAMSKLVDVIERQAERAAL